jgi:hypothetical protein
MSDRRASLYIFSIAVLVVLGLMSLVLPALTAPRPAPTSLPPDLNATVDARLTRIAQDAVLFSTATAIIQEAIGGALAATARAESERAEREALAETATAIPYLTVTARHREALAATAEAAQATSRAMLAAQTATSQSLTATVAAMSTRFADGDSAHAATAVAQAAARAAFEAGLRSADVLDASSAGRIGLLAALPHTGPVGELTTSPDGRRLAGASGSTVLLWSLYEGVEVARLDHPVQVTGLTFSPDSALLATAAVDGVIRLWDAAAGALRTTLHGHTDVVFRLAFSPEGSLLASAGADAARLWQVRSGAALAVLATGWTWQVTFSPGGRYVVTADGDGRVRVWGVPLHPTPTLTATPTPTPR